MIPARIITNIIHGLIGGALYGAEGENKRSAKCDLGRDNPFSSQES
jgi:hypothetical protein